jgi:type VI secretion system protein ImpH
MDASIDRLLAQPHRFQFFQALRLVERWHAQSGTPRREVLARHVHFRNSLALHFPPSEIESLRALPALPDRDDDGLDAGALPQLEMVPAFFGLLGANGALPLFYTELFAQREAYHKDRAARAFLDVFQQRAVSLLYEAWRKHRLPLQYEDERRKHFLPAVLALTGLAHGPAREDAAAHLPDESVAYFAGSFQQRTRSAVQMQRVLQMHFGVAIRVEQFVGRWHALPDEAQTCLGHSGGVLGESALVGARVWQRDLRLRLVIGPLKREQFARFLPHGRSAQALRELLTLMTGITLEYEVQLLLAPDDAPPLVLGAADAPARLGWDSWLLSRAPAAPLNDARYDIHATA